MAVDKDYAMQLGRAWAQHRENNNLAAITEFNAILKQSAENIDALYGLGLALRAQGQREDAISNFRSALQLVENALVLEPGKDRFEMMHRMISQRLTELDAPILPR